MRPVLTILMITLLIGGMWAYVDFKEGVVLPASDNQVAYATQKTMLEVRRSSTLYDGGGLGGPALTVSIKGNTVLELNRTITAQEKVEIEIPEVAIGKNTLSVQANFEDPEAFLSDALPQTLYAIEVVVRHGNKQLHREVFTSPEPFVVGGQVFFEVQQQTTLVDGSGPAAMGERP